MATRIFRLYGTLGVSAADQVLTNGPLSPPSGIKWTVVEYRPAMGDLGHIDCFFDTELYHTLVQESTNQIAMPRVVALDIVQPHQLRVLATDDSGNGQDVDIEIVVEESPQGGA